jgi:hypothetical protein
MAFTSTAAIGGHHQTSVELDPADAPSATTVYMRMLKGKSSIYSHHLAAHPDLLEIERYPPSFLRHSELLA